VGGLVCVFFSWCPVWLRCDGSSDCGGVLEYMYMRPMRLGPWGPCMLHYIATLLGLAKSIETIHSNNNCTSCLELHLVSQKCLRELLCCEIVRP
jgi:hypothetical protein